MKKTAIASAVALVIGTSAMSAAQANTAGLTGVWTGTYTFSMFDPGGSPVGSPTSDSWTWDFDAGTVTIQNSATFFFSVWTAAGVTFSDTGSSYDGNMTFSWSANGNIPVFSSWDITGSGGAPGQVSDTASVAVNSAVILATSSAFPGFQPYFSGSLHKDSCGSTTGQGLCGEYVEPPEPPQPPQVPVPAAVWLMGSGLMGLVGVARRRRNKA